MEFEINVNELVVVSTLAYVRMYVCASEERRRGKKEKGAVDVNRFSRFLYVGQ